MELGYFDLQRHQRWLEEKDKPRRQQRLGTFSRVEIDGANLEDMYLPDVNLEQAKIVNTSFAHSYLKGAIFNGADLRGLNLSFASVEDASFVRANLTGGTFAGCISGANFSASDLKGAKFEGVNVYGSNFTGCDLRNIDWGYHPYPFIKPRFTGITNANFSGARGVYHTKFSEDEAILSVLREKEITFFFARPVVQENYTRHVVQVETTYFESHQQALKSGIVVSQFKSVRNRRAAGITEHIDFWISDVSAHVLASHTADEWDINDEWLRRRLYREGAILALTWYSFISKEKAENLCDEHEKALEIPKGD